MPGKVCLEEALLVEKIQTTNDKGGAEKVHFL
jgi:hypothetical protein